MKYSKEQTTPMSKHGIDLTLFPDHCENAEVALVHVWFIDESEADVDVEEDF